jgi:two-component system, OmpR family, phosphate regulon sensor histidine kinase PhoR
MLRLLLGAVIAITLAPLLVLLGLVLAGALAALPALVAAVAIIAGAVGLALIWAEDLTLVRRALREAALPAATARPPALPQMALLTGDIERLSRQMAERDALVARLLKTDDAIIETLPDPLLVLGADRAVKRTNLAARTAFGGDLQAVLRQPALRDAIGRALAADGGPVQVEFALPVPVPRDVVATVLPLDPPLPDGGRVILVLSDRTRERALERMRADFVANASHELRTPLASLIGFIETLRGPAREDAPARERFLGIMAEQAERMNRLIADLLSLSRVELSEHQAPAERVELRALVDRMLAELEPRRLQRRMHMELSAPEALPQVLGDPDQLMQVLQNLLDNAVKYGAEAGCVRVRLEAVSGGRWPARLGVLLSVTDDGPGIAKIHLPRLTERFYRVDKGRSRAVGGTGLGLAIVKHVVNRHRGQLVIDSEEGKGASFMVWLPAAPPPESAAAAPA